MYSITRGITILIALTILTGTSMGSQSGYGTQRIEIASIVDLLRDSDAEVRKCGVKMLGRLGPVARIATKDLLNVFDDSDPAIRREVIISLIQIRANGDIALPTLIKGSNDQLSDVRSRQCCLVSAPQRNRKRCLCSDLDPD